MTTTTECETEVSGDYPQRLRVRTHEFRTDLSIEGGGKDSAPGAHDYFDAALASCKSVTAMWYAKKKGISLERVEVRITRDSSEERSGTYRLGVELVFHGAMSDDERAKLYAAVAHCPVHKLMTTVDVIIETAPLAPPAGTLKE
jgi:putative redox protein